MNWWEEMMVQGIVGVLHGIKLNPAKLPAFKEALVLIIETACGILGVEPPLIP